MVRNRKKICIWFQLWLVLLVLLIGNDSVAWGPQGHRVVGYVAESRLQPEIKKIILEKFNINSLADVATWADVIRKKREEEKPWHYTNIAEGQLTYDAARDCPDRSCVTEQIHKFSGVLGDLSAPLDKRKDALKYLVHFVGDVHQPLHLGNKKDRGGGTLRFPYKGRVVSLHYLWDGGLVDWQDSPLKYAMSLNGRILEIEIYDWNLSTVSDWANESRSIALSSAYNIKSDNLSKSYITKSREIIDLRLAQAGIRLAHLLNTILTIK